MVQQQLPSATSYFSPKLKRALITQSTWVKERLHRVQRLQHAVLKQCTSPSKLCQGNAWRRPWQATVAWRRCPRLQFHREANRARDLFGMASQ